MPTRGYRKGLTDSKEPRTRSIRTHVTQRVFDRFAAEADLRNLTYSKLLAALIKAHQSGTRLEVPQPRHLSAELMRKLAGALNNLNQLTRQLNTGLVPVTATELRQTLRAVEDIARAVRG